MLWGEVLLQVLFISCILGQSKQNSLILEKSQRENSYNRIFCYCKNMFSFWTSEIAVNHGWFWAKSSIYDWLSITPWLRCTYEALAPAELNILYKLTFLSSSSFLLCFTEAYDICLITCGRCSPESMTVYAHTMHLGWGQSCWKLPQYIAGMVWFQQPEMLPWNNITVELLLSLEHSLFSYVAHLSCRSVFIMNSFI